MKYLQKSYGVAFLLIFLLAQSTHVFANKHALLVGISEYHVKPLAGPVNDVRAVRSALTKYWGFKSKNINVLLNKQATKSNIITQINQLYDNSESGDEIFIYLSGHGTSASDRTINVPLPTTTGAFIPVDVNNIKNTAQLIEKLIIGIKDLRPIFTKFDDGNRKVFVAIDACYSGNTVRGMFSKDKLPTRFLSFTDLLPTRGFGDDFGNDFGDDVSPMSTRDWEKVGKNSDNAYPYKNIFYLSASGEHEPAQDIPSNMLDRYPTIDAKPHGAFTDSLLRILTKKLDADVNRDGKVSYAELKKIIRIDMRQRGFNHTPQGLPTLAEDRNNISDQSLFSTSRGLSFSTDSKPKESKPNHVGTTTQQIKNHLGKIQNLQVKLDDSIKFLKTGLKDIDSIQIVSSNEDIRITRQDKNILLLTASGDLINSLNDASREDLVDILTQQAWLKKNLNQPYPQDFVVELDLYGSGRGSTATNGQLIGFSIRATKNAYLLLIDIDPNGKFSVIYPINETEMKQYPAAKSIILKNISRVRPPFGRDIVQVYAFNKISEHYKKLAGKQFSLNDEEMEHFEKLISDTTLGKARASLELITTPRQ